MSDLRVKGVRIQNLEEFRRNFDFTNARDYLYQGRLSVWMREIGENDLADELDELKSYDSSDQTLLDNFKRIFGLKKNEILPPVKAEVPAESAFLPAVQPDTAALPTVFDPAIKRTEECAYADSAVCFRDTRNVGADESLTMYNVKGNTPADLHQYMKNKMALKLLREVVLEVLPPGIHDKFGYQIELTGESRLDADLGLDLTLLQKLSELLYRKFRIPFSVRSDGLHFSWDTYSTVQKLLEKLSHYELHSYTDEEAEKLLEEGF